MPRLRTAFALVLLASALQAAERAPTPLSFARLNRTYENLVSEAPPYVTDAVTIKLRSPQQSVTLVRHALRLLPLADGTFRAVVEGEFSGRGKLVAGVSLLGAAEQSFEDELVVAHQLVSLPARLRITRVEGGYRFTALELPTKVAVGIQSRLAGRVLTLCNGAALLAFGALDCSAVETALTRVEVPLPPAGNDFFLADGEIGAGERAALEALLATATQRGR